MLNDGSTYIIMCKEKNTAGGSFANCHVYIGKTFEKTGMHKDTKMAIFWLKVLKPPWYNVEKTNANT